MQRAYRVCAKVHAGHRADISDKGPAAGYLNSTPILFSLRQTTWQDRFSFSLSMISLNLSGMNSGVFVSIRAPVLEIFLTLQGIVPPAPRSMMPDFSTRFRGAIRLRSIIWFTLAVASARLERC